MTTLSNRPNTALMVIDVQKGVVADAHKRDVVVEDVPSSVELRWRPGEHQAALTS